MRGGKFVDGIQAFGFQMGGVQAEMDLLGVFARGGGEGNNFLGENLGLVIAVVDFADDEDGGVGLEELAVLVEVLIHAEELHGAFEVFNSDEGVGFVAFFGDAILYGGDETAD